MRSRITATIMIAALLVPFVLAAQQQEPPGEIIDRVVAVVEDRAILLSEIEMEYRQYLLQNQMSTLPEDQEAQLRAQLLERLIGDQLLAVHADKTGIEVPDEAIEEDLARALEESRRSAGGDAMFESELEKAGLTLQQLRSQWKEKIRSNFLRQQLLRDVFKDVTVTDTEVRAYYREHLDEMPKRPASMKIAQIKILPGVAEEKSDASLERIKVIEAEVKAGKDFAEAATEYSEGPSAKYGGSLGYMNLAEFGERSPKFEKAARKLIAGEVSPPVLTHFGWHLIKLEDVSGDQVKLRHILIKVETDDAQIADAAARAEEVRREILDGLDFAIAAAKYSSDEKTKNNGGVMEEEINLELLVGNNDYLLEMLRETEIDGLTPVIKEGEEFRIIKVLEKNPSRAWTYQEAKPELENMLG
ncbi:MAG: peptidylprolyl isomerase, partial [Candidatus Krumholzibacteria bacterium]|nr:peptidylprolyl isomerase [Candidatus Krumholzibacteria bacterium]